MTSLQDYLLQFSGEYTRQEEAIIAINALPGFSQHFDGIRTLDPPPDTPAMQAIRHILQWHTDYEPPEGQECHMCGRERSLDAEGLCSECRTVYYS